MSAAIIAHAVRHAPELVLKAWAEARAGYVTFYVSRDPWGRPYRCELVIDGEHERIVSGDSWDEVTREAAELVTRNPELNLETEQS